MSCSLLHKPIIANAKRKINTHIVNSLYCLSSLERRSVVTYYRRETIQLSLWQTFDQRRLVNAWLWGSAPSKYLDKIYFVFACMILLLVSQHLSAFIINRFQMVLYQFLDVLPVCGALA